MAVKKPKSEEKPELQSPSFLPEAQRKNFIEKLETLGYVGGADLSDTELLEKFQELAVIAHQEKVSDEASLIQTKMAGLFGESNISNIDFKLQLFNAGVDKRYIHLFDDSHAKLVQIKTDKEGEEYTDMERIWEIIRFSGINPITPAELFKYRGDEPTRRKPPTINY